MKTNNKKKVVVSVLALAMGAGLAGSISGSVAWYQYSTRVAASLSGTSAGTTRNLQISSDNGTNWAQNINLGTEVFRPASVYGTAGSLSFVDHPVYQYDILPAAVAGEEGDPVFKAEYNFVFKCEDNSGSGATQVAKDVYLSHLAIVGPTEEQIATGKRDITPAVRIEIDGANDFIVASEAGTTTTSGNLDLNGNGAKDTIEYDTLDQGSTKITYKNAATGGDSYTTVAPESVVVTDAGLANPYDFSADTGLADKVLATTKTGSAVSNTVKITVWIEGWQELNSSVTNPAANNSVWDIGWVEQNFKLELQFTCVADR